MIHNQALVKDSVIPSHAMTTESTILSQSMGWQSRLRLWILLSRQSHTRSRLLSWQSFLGPDYWVNDPFLGLGYQVGEPSSISDHWFGIPFSGSGPWVSESLVISSLGSYLWGSHNHGQHSQVVDDEGPVFWGYCYESHFFFACSLCMLFDICISFCR